MSIANCDRFPVSCDDGMRSLFGQIPFLVENVGKYYDMLSLGLIVVKPQDAAFGLMVLWFYRPAVFWFDFRSATGDTSSKLGNWAIGQLGLKQFLSFDVGKPALFWFGDVGPLYTFAQNEIIAGRMSLGCS